MRRKVLIVAAATVLASVIPVPPPASAGETVTAVRSGEWDDPETWGGAAPPLFLSGTVGAVVVIIPDGVEVEISGGLIVELDGNLEVEGSLDVRSGSELRVSGHLENRGVVEMRYGTVRAISTGAIDNYGLLEATANPAVAGTLRLDDQSARLWNHPFGEIRLHGRAETFGHSAALIVGPGTVVNASYIENDGAIFNDGGGAIHQLCGGSISGLPVIGDPPLDQCDTTPPEIVLDVTATLGDNGWYTSTVQIDWTITDPESLILDTDGCTTLSVVSDTAGATFACEATSYGGTDSRSITVKRDATPPTVTASVTPAPNPNGWHNTSVEVSFSGSDAMSGVASCDPPVVLASEGAGQSATGECTDNAGNVGSDTATGIDIDLTPPVIVFTGNAGTYQVSDTVAISCSATDALSGIDTSVCPGRSGPPYTFDLEEPTVLNASATDLAGNTTEDSTSFTVVVDREGVMQLVDQFIDDSVWVDQVQRTTDQILVSDGLRQQKMFEKLERDLTRMVGSYGLTQPEADLLLQLVGILCHCNV